MFTDHEGPGGKITALSVTYEIPGGLVEANRLPRSGEWMVATRLNHGNHVTVHPMTSEHMEGYIKMFAHLGGSE